MSSDEKIFTPPQLSSFLKELNDRSKVPTIPGRIAPGETAQKAAVVGGREVTGLTEGGGSGAIWHRVQIDAGRYFTGKRFNGKSNPGPHTLDGFCSYISSSGMFGEPEESKALSDKVRSIGEEILKTSPEEGQVVTHDFRGGRS